MLGPNIAIKVYRDQASQSAIENHNTTPGVKSFLLPREKSTAKGIALYTT